MPYHNHNLGKKHVAISFNGFSKSPAVIIQRGTSILSLIIAAYFDHTHIKTDYATLAISTNVPFFPDVSVPHEASLT
jgi:hypothetical protein